LTLQKIIILIALLVGQESFAQKNEIDKYSKTVDSFIMNNKDIVLHAVRHQTPYDSARYFDYFYIDTSKDILIKSIYDFNFEGDGEYLEFYYSNSEIIKVNAKHKLDDRKFSGTFYFKSESLIAQTDGEISPGKTVFDIQEILKTGNGYKSDIEEIIKSIKKSAER